MTILVDSGRWARHSLLNAGYTVNLFLHAIGSIHYLPRRIRFTLDHAYVSGVRALPVTLVVGLFAGMILALQTGIELKQLGQSDMIGTITALSMCREMGPFMTAVILAAMVGSSIAAEIGTMSVSEEITALDVMSVDSTNYLVLPRIISLTIMTPILTVFSNFIGIVGGSIVGDIHLGVSGQLYWVSVIEALSASDSFLPKDVYVGLLKALVFGALISTVSCSAGLRADGGALGVGRAVTSAVMISIILIIIIGYIITWFFYFLIAG